MNETAQKQEQQAAPAPVVQKERVIMPEVLPKEDYSLAALAANLEAKLSVCELLANSGVLPSWVKAKETVFAIITNGQELGFSPMQSFRYLYLVNGKIGIEARGKQALCKSKAGVKFKTLEDTDEACCVEARRGDEVETFRFTMKDAERAQVMGKDNWKKHPRDMMYAKCLGRVCDRIASDVTGGLPTIEELEDGDFPEPPLDQKSLSNVISAELRTGATKPINPVEHKQPVDPKAFCYDISVIEDPELWGKVAEYLQKNGAKQEEGSARWYSPVELGKASKYLVKYLVKEA